MSSDTAYCNDQAPRAWKDISSHPGLGSACVLAPQSLGHGFIKNSWGVKVDILAEGSKFPQHENYIQFPKKGQVTKHM